MHRTFQGTKAACYIGYFVQAIINNLSPLLFVIYRNAFGISVERIGSLILINFLTQTAVDILAVKIVDKIGYKKIVVLSHFFATVGLVLLSVLPRTMSNSFFALIIATMISACGSGMIEVTISPIVESIPSQKKEADMSLLHSFYCWGQMGVVAVSTLTMHFIGTEFWFILPVFWAVIPLLNMLNFLSVPFMRTLSEAEKIPLKKLFKSKVFIIAMVLMLCAGASEIAMSQWSSYFAEIGLGVSKVTGDLLGPCLFAVFMGLGRLFYGIKGDKINLVKALAVCATLCILCYFTTAVSSNALVSLFACALTGLSVSLFWPGTFSLAAKAYPNGGTSMFGIMALLGDIGCASGPWLVSLVSTGAQTAGGLSENSALKTGLGFGIIFPFVIIICLVLLDKLQKNKVDIK